MNKKMSDLLAKIKDKLDAAGEETDVAKRKALLGEITALKDQYETEKGLYEASLLDVPDEGAKPAAKVNGFELMAKVARGKGLTDRENAVLVTGTDATNGEGYLVPEDVRLKINELRRQFLSAKDLITVIPTKALSGKFNFESGNGGGLVAFDDGDTIDSSEAPSFSQKTFAIGLYGKIIPVSNVLQGAEEAGLMAYLRGWFVRNAIISENAKIFTQLKSGKIAKVLGSATVPVWDALKKSINVDLDPAAKDSGVIVTNQTGFQILDGAKDDNGRPILTPNPTDGTRKTFCGLTIHVFSNAQLANNVDGTAPILYGDIKNAAYFMDMLGYQFAASAHAGFDKNQTHMRVIEGFDVIQADTADACYCLGKMYVDPTITIATQPADASVTAGSISGSLSVSASASDGTTLAYQWYSNARKSSVGGTAIASANSSSLTIPTTLTAGKYYYYCVITAGETVVATNVATVTVAAAGG